MLGVVQVVPPRAGRPTGASTWTSPALWRSYRAKETAGQNKIRITKVSTLPGEPRAPHGTWLVHYEIGGQQLADYWFYVHRQ